MPYTVPTVEQFQTRFPVLADTDPALIQMLLTEAAGKVSTSWVEADFQPAILYLTAHLIATDNSAEGEAVEIGSAGGGAIKSESMGGLSITYGSDAGAGTTLSANEIYGGTVYGRRFLYLLNLNFYGPAVV